MATKQALHNQQTVVPGPAKRPAKGLMKLMNPIMKLLLASPLRGRAGQKILLLSFTGRKSGKQFTTPVGYHRLGEDTLLLFTHSPWVKNLYNNATVKVLVDGVYLKGVANATSDPDTVLAYVRDYLARHGLAAARQIALQIPTDHDLSDEEWRQLVRGLSVVPIKIVGNA